MQEVICGGFGEGIAELLLVIALQHFLIIRRVGHECVFHQNGGAVFDAGQRQIGADGAGAVALIQPGEGGGDVTRRVQRRIVCVIDAAAAVGRIIGGGVQRVAVNGNTEVGLGRDNLRHAVSQRQGAVVAAGHDDGSAELLQPRFGIVGDNQVDVLLQWAECAGRARRAAFLTAVAGVQQHHRAAKIGRFQLAAVDGGAELAPDNQIITAHLGVTAADESGAFFMQFDDQRVILAGGNVNRVEQRVGG